MEYNLVITARASEDKSIAVNYYDSINPKLGDRFLDELLEIFKKLSVNPQHYSFVLSNRKSNIRDVKMRSFPFVVIYEVREHTVMVISVMNTHRKPLFL